jgi:hypothetical protein
LSLRPNNGDAAYFLGATLIALGETPEGEKYLRQGLSDMPSTLQLQRQRDLSVLVEKAKSKAVSAPVD